MYTNVKSLQKSDFSHIKIYTKYKKMKVTTAYFQM